MVFKKGQSGNPKGRPKRDQDIAMLAREHTTKAINLLIKVMENDKERQTSARVRAAEILLNRGWGSAPQKMEITGADGGVISIEQRRKAMQEAVRNPKMRAALAVLAEESAKKNGEGEGLPN